MNRWSHSDKYFEKVVRESHFENIFIVWNFFPLSVLFTLETFLEFFSAFLRDKWNNSIALSLLESCVMLRWRWNLFCWLDILRLPWTMMNGMPRSPGNSRMSWICSEACGLVHCVRHIIFPFRIIYDYYREQLTYSQHIPSLIFICGSLIRLFDLMTDILK